MIEPQMILCKKIRIPKGAKLHDATLQQLEDSIKAEGMYNPIILRPDPEHPGDYLIVQGRHRFTVVSKKLKQELIEAKVFADMDREEADLAAMTENACRHAPNGTKRLLLIQEWQEAFRKKYPDLIGRKASGKASGSSRSRKAEAEATTATEAGAGESNNGHSDHCSTGEAQATEAVADEAKQGEGRQSTFRERLASSTGQSESSVTRDIRIANGFTKEQLEVLEPLNVAKLDLLAIISVTKDNENERAEIVNLVCSGMPVAEAIREVTGQTEVKDVAGRTKESDTAEGAEAKKAEAKGTELPDDEWFETYCGQFAKLLGKPEKYKTDAILFRMVSDARAAFRKKVKKPFAKARDRVKGSQNVGPFFFLLHRLLNASHPKDWLYCDACKGKGSNENGGPCKKCGEAGYFIKTEKYV
jgi:hypothetical protein